MFDITSSKLFLLAIVALLVIGPKDFPVLLRAIGKYMGIIRGHAREFRAQFDEAMRESELSQLKQDMETMARETEASLNATSRSVEQTFDEARQGVEHTVTANPLAPAADPPEAPAANATPPTEAGADAPTEPPPAVTPTPEPFGPGTATAQAAEPAPAPQPAVERPGA